MSAGLVATVAAVLLLAGVLVWRWCCPGGASRHGHGPRRRGRSRDARARPPRDEIGAMAESWNAMTAELRPGPGGARRVEPDPGAAGRGEDAAARSARIGEMLLVREDGFARASWRRWSRTRSTTRWPGIRTYARLLRRGAAPTGSLPRRRDGPHPARSIDERGRPLRRHRPQHAALQPLFARPLRRRGRGAAPRALPRAPAPSGRDLGSDPGSRNARICLASHCDGSQIEQMILALAMNALEATPSGGR